MNEYREMIIKAVQESYTEYGFYVRKLTRNNGIEHHCLCATLGPDIPFAPIIPCEVYEAGLEVGSWTMNDVLEDVQNLMKQRMEIGTINLADFQSIKGKVFLRVTNYEKNRGNLENVPHRKFLDLVVTYWVELLCAPGTEGTFLVTNGIMNCWNTSEEELWELAYGNTFKKYDVKIYKIVEVLKGILGDIGMDYELPDEQEFMYVANCEKRVYGATCVLKKEAFRSFAETKGTDLFIIPSSIFECIVICKQEDIREETVKRMVKEVTANTTTEESFLSNHVYLYERERDELKDLCENSAKEYI